MRLRLFARDGAGRSDPDPDFGRRRLVVGLALAPVVLKLLGCREPNYCQVSWYGGPSSACFDHNFQPGDMVLRGIARAGEHEIILRNRLAPSVLTPEQQAVIFDLLTMSVDGESVEFDRRGGYTFVGGEDVIFRLMDFEFIIDVAEGDGELSQLDLFDDSVLVTQDADAVADRTDSGDLGYGLGFVVIRGGAVHEPGPSEMVFDEHGMEHFVPQVGDRLVYLSIDHLPAAV